MAEQNPLTDTKIYSLKTTKNKRLVSISFWLVKFSGLIFLLVFISGITFAQQEEPITIGVYPPIFELELEKGDVYKNQILLRNKSELAIPIKTEAVNFTAKDEFGGISFEIHETDTKKEHETDAKKWFKIEKPDFILEPKGSERIKFKINVPKNVERGGYYGTVLFQSKLPSYYFEKEAARAIPQIGVLFLISVGKRGKADIEIVEFDIPEERRIKILERFFTRNKHETPHQNEFGAGQAEHSEGETYGAGETDTKLKIVDGSHLPFILRVKNNDIYHVKPSGTLEIYKFAENSSLQNLIGRTEIKEITILPGKIRQFPVDFHPALFEKLDSFLPNFLANFISENLFLGKYKVLLKLHGSAEVEKEMDFWILPWKSVIILLLLVILILFIILQTRKRRRGQQIQKYSASRKKFGDSVVARKKKVVLNGIKKTGNE